MSVTEAVQYATLDPELREVAADLLRLEAGVSLTVAQIARVTGESKRTVLRRLSDASPVAAPVDPSSGTPRYSARDVRRIWGTP